MNISYSQKPKLTHKFYAHNGCSLAMTASIVPILVVIFRRCLKSKTMEMTVISTFKAFEFMIHKDCSPMGPCEYVLYTKYVIPENKCNKGSKTYSHDNVLVHRESIQREYNYHFFVSIFSILDVPTSYNFLQTLWSRFFRKMIWDSVVVSLYISNSVDDFGRFDCLERIEPTPTNTYLQHLKRNSMDVKNTVCIMETDPLYFPQVRSNARPTDKQFLYDDGLTPSVLCDSLSKKKSFLQGGRTNFSEADIKKMKIDSYNSFAMSRAPEAAIMCRYIVKLVKKHNKSCKNIVITDACAGCGGNTMQFSSSGIFKVVNAVEINWERCENYLRHNIRTVESIRPMLTHKTKTNVYYGNYLFWMHHLHQHVVFFDLPWGGKQYKEMHALQLFLQNHHLARIIRKLFFQRHITQTKHIIIKAPLNFDVDNMRKRLGTLGRHFEKLYSSVQWNVYAITFYKHYKKKGY